jgi:hypothetical protein
MLNKSYQMVNAGGLFFVARMARIILYKLLMRESAGNPLVMSAEKPGTVRFWVYRARRPRAQG